MPNVMAALGILAMRSESSIIQVLVPCRKAWLTPTAPVPSSNAGKTGECKNWTQSEFYTWQNSITGQKPPKMYI